MIFFIELDKKSHKNLKKKYFLREHELRIN